MFIFRLENDETNGPFSSIGYNSEKLNIREMLIKHLVPEEQGLSNEELDRVKCELIYDLDYHFAWSTAHLISKYIQFEHIYNVQHTGFKVAVYKVPNEHTYILPKDGQVIFDRNHQTKVGVFEFHDFCLNTDWKQFEEDKI